MTRSPTLIVTLASVSVDADASCHQFFADVSCAVIRAPVGVTVGVAVGVGVAVAVGVGVGVLVGVAVGVGVGVAVGVVVGVGVGVDAPDTTTVPCISWPWAEQKNVYVPGVLNVQ